MKAHQAEHPVQTQCRVLGLFVSGFYASQTRAPSARSLQDAWLLERITNTRDFSCCPGASTKAEDSSACPLPVSVTRGSAAGPA